MSAWPPPPGRISGGSSARRRRGSIRARSLSRCGRAIWRYMPTRSSSGSLQTSSTTRSGTANGLPGYVSIPKSPTGGSALSTRTTASAFPMTQKRASSSGGSGDRPDSGSSSPGRSSPSPISPYVRPASPGRVHDSRSGFRRGSTASPVAAKLGEFHLGRAEEVFALLDEERAPLIDDDALLKARLAVFEFPDNPSQFFQHLFKGLRHTLSPPRRRPPGRPSS